MKHLKEILEESVRRTTFLTRDRSTGEERSISPKQLRSTLKRSYWGDEEFRKANTARLVVPYSLLGHLESHLRPLLKNYINPATDLIGHALPGIGSGGRMIRFQDNGLLTGQSLSSPFDFAESIARGAAILGSGRVVSLLSSWLNEEPVRHRISVVLNAPGVRESINPIDGVHIDPLPLSTDKLPSNLPNLTGETGIGYIGRSVLTIDCSVSPPFFRPEAGQSELVVEASPLPSADVEAVCQALALTLNADVEVGVFWNDYQEVEAFVNSNVAIHWTGESGYYSTREHVGQSVREDPVSGVLTVTDTTQLTSEVDEQQLRGILGVLANRSSGRVRTAISRWMKSKRPRGDLANLTDSFIDLRIALESMFLQDFLGGRSQEMRLRLALVGAWYLGTNLAERKEISDALRKAYDRASEAVHGGDLDSTQENRELLVLGQDLCREGILKFLNEGPPPNWRDLILGAEGVPEDQLLGNERI